MPDIACDALTSDDGAESRPKCSATERENTAVTAGQRHRFLIYGSAASPLGLDWSN